MELALRSAMERTAAEAPQRTKSRKQQRRYQEDIMSRTLRDHQT